MSASAAATLLLTVLLAGAASPPSVGAQGGAPGTDGAGFLTRFDYRLSGEHLVNDDDRFVWDMEFGGELDLVDYGTGRLTFLAEYETIVGGERHAFDPNQSNYTLEASGSRRFAWGEVAGVLHHVSRHFSDRPKVVPIDWNMIGVDVVHVRTAGTVVVTARGRALASFLKGVVDYRGEVSGRVALRWPVRHLSGTAAFELVAIPVDGTMERSGVVTGGRAEAGILVPGRRADMTLFGAIERRIDAHPLERRARHWAVVGLRFSGS